MTVSLTWSQIDTNPYTKGYLDEAEVKKAKSQGINNVSVNMIQAEYEGTIDVDKIRTMFDRGANGQKIPVYGTITQRNKVLELYKDYIITQYKYENLKNEFKDKFNLFDDFMNLLSKTTLVKSNQEYNSYKARIDELEVQMQLKKKELENYISTEFYEAYKNPEIEPGKMVQGTFTLASR